MRQLPGYQIITEMPKQNSQHKRLAILFFSKNHCDINSRYIAKYVTHLQHLEAVIHINAAGLTDNATKNNLILRKKNKRYLKKSIKSAKINFKKRNQFMHRSTVERGSNYIF